MASLKNTIINDTGFLQIPAGTTAQRPVSPAAGMYRFNTDELLNEYYDGTQWVIPYKIRAVPSVTFLAVTDNLSDLTSYSGTTALGTTLGADDVLVALIQAESYSVPSITSVNLSGAAIIDARTSQSGQRSVAAVARNSSFVGSSVNWSITYGGQQYRMRISFWKISPSKTGSTFAVFDTSITVNGPLSDTVDMSNCVGLMSAAANDYNTGEFILPGTKQYDLQVEYMRAGASYITAQTNPAYPISASISSNGEAFAFVSYGYI